MEEVGRNLVNYDASTIEAESQVRDPESDLADDATSRLEYARRLRRHLDGLPGSVALSLAALCVLLPFARLDFDAHHDGIMLAAAIAVRDGFHVQGDVFAQYGPITPWLQALALLLPLSPALAIRVLNVLLIAVVVFVLSDIGRVRPAYWPTRTWTGRLAAVAWIGLADVFGWVPMLPWSSTVAAALSAIGLYCIVRALHQCNLERTLESRKWSFVAGLMIGLLPFARVNVGLATLATFLAIGLCVACLRTPEATCARFGLVGALTSIVMILTMLAITHSLADWWQQTIIFPPRWATDAADRNDTGMLFERAVKALLVPLVVVAVLSVMWLLVRATSNRTRWALQITSTALGCWLLFYFFLGQTRPRVIGGASISVGNPWILEITRNFNYLAFVSWSIIVVAPLVVVVCVCLAIFCRLDRRTATAWLLLAGFALAGLVQIWPVSDTRHYWWGLPIGLLLLFSIPSNHSSGERLLFRIQNPYLLTTIATLVIAAFTGYSYLGVSRQPAPAGSPVSGMLMGVNQAGDQTAHPLDEDFKTLRLAHIPYRATLFWVNDGVLSVFDDRYNNSDEYFLYFGGARSLDQRLAKLPYVVVDNPLIPLVAGEMSDRHYVLAGRNAWISVFRPPSSTEDGFTAGGPTDKSPFTGAARRPGRADNPL